jgi:ribosomal protein L35
MPIYFLLLFSVLQFKGTQAALLAQKAAEHAHINQQKLRTQSFHLAIAQIVAHSDITHQ